MRTTAFALVIAICCHPALSSAAVPETKSINFSGTLRAALSYVSKTFRIPYFAEYDCSSSKPIKLEASGITGETALVAIAQQAGLKVSSVAGVLYLSDSSIIESPFDQLNYVFPSFIVPQDADSFLIVLHSRLYNDFGKKPDDLTLGGFAASGIGNDAMKNKLREEDLENISARDLILREIASQSFWITVCYARPVKPHPGKEPIPPEGLWSWGESKSPGK